MPAGGAQTVSSKLAATWSTQFLRKQAQFTLPSSVTLGMPEHFTLGAAL